MNILFDCISLQDRFANGGSEYSFVILSELSKKNGVKIFPCAKKDVQIREDAIKILKPYNTPTCELGKNPEESLASFIRENKIDVFYIGISQRYNDYDLTKLKCRLVLTCHDIADLVLSYENKMHVGRAMDFVRKYTFNRKKLYRFMASFKGYYLQKDRISYYWNFSKLIKQPNVHLVTVSEYTKNSIEYYLGKCANEPKVYYSPMKIVADVDNISIQNEKLADLVKNKEKYFLLISCDRVNKNAVLFTSVWNKFCEATNYEYKAVMLGRQNYSDKNIIQIDSLSGSDLEHAYKNSFAFVYPSLCEGFGYPPFEAMKWGTPVLSSNVTSMPEVLSDSVYYFNPCYPEDLFSAMKKVIESPHIHRDRAFNRLNEISNRQREDLEKLVELIMTKETV